MAMNQDTIRALLGAEVRSVDEHRVGEVEQVFVDDETGAPKWVTVHTGLFGAATSYIPVENAQLEGNLLRVPFEKRVIGDAPRVEADQGHLSPAEEDDLDHHYGARGGVAGVSGTGLTGSAGNRAGVGDGVADSSGDGVAVIRSEEQLRIGTRIVPTGRLRLRKRIVTETRTIEVSVSREELVVDDDEVFDDTAGTDVEGTGLVEDEFEIVLHEESIVVEKRVVPFERVRVRKHVVQGTTTVSDQVQKEKVDTERVGDS